jgi:hypothetical protein
MISDVPITYVARELKLMTAEEIAHCLQVSERAIWRLKAKGDLPKSVRVWRTRSYFATERRSPRRENSPATRTFARR